MNLSLIKSQITSFQGKRLHEIYSKNNEFHASRRSWYLPVSPSPPHPDATSKKMQKRFPTLDLQHRASLRWDSYVNIRHVYKIDWALLRPYANPETLHVQSFCLDRESSDKMLAKTKVLTNYEPEMQHQIQYSHQPNYEAYPGRPRYHHPSRATTSGPPLHIPQTPVRYASDHPANPRSQDYSPYSPRASSMYSPTAYSDAGSVVGSEYSGLSPILQSDFGAPQTEFEMYSPVPRKRPPHGALMVVCHIIFSVFAWPWRVLCRLRERVVEWWDGDRQSGVVGRGRFD